MEVIAEVNSDQLQSTYISIVLKVVEEKPSVNNESVINSKAVYLYGGLFYKATNSFFRLNDALLN